MITSVRMRLLVFIFLFSIAARGQVPVGGEQSEEDVRPAPCLRASKQLRFWSSELTSANVEDFKRVVQRGVKLDAVFDDLSRAADCADHKSCPPAADQPMVLSNPDSNAWNLCPFPHRLRRQFFKAYVNASEMRSVDALFSSTPPANAELYMPFNKSQIVVVSQPLDVGRESHFAFWLWINNLVQIARCPRNIVVANSLYYQKFVKYYTGIEVPLIPSYAGHVTHTYSPSGQRVYVHFDASVPVGGQGAAALAADIAAKLRAATSFEPVLAPLPNRNDWAGIASFRAVVLVPTTPNEVFCTALYRLNLPMFVPSTRLLAEWEETKYVTRSRINWRHVPDMAAPTLPYHPYNISSRAAVEYWLGFSDFYQWPQVQVFDTLDELAAKLKAASLDEISQAMADANAAQLSDVVAAWTTQFHRAFGEPRLPPGGYDIPRQFDLAMRERYQTLLQPEPPICVRKVCQPPNAAATYDPLYADQHVPKDGKTCEPVPPAPPPQ